METYKEYRIEIRELPEGDWEQWSIPHREINRLCGWRRDINHNEVIETIAHWNDLQTASEGDKFEYRLVEREVTCGEWKESVPS